MSLEAVHISIDDLTRNKEVPRSMALRMLPGQELDFILANPWGLTDMKPRNSFGLNSSMDGDFVALGDQYQTVRPVREITDGSLKDQARYWLRREHPLGKSVYFGWDIRLQKPVAVKMLVPSVDLYAREVLAELQKEAEGMALVQPIVQRHMVDVYDMLLVREAKQDSIAIIEEFMDPTEAPTLFEVNRSVRLTSGQVVDIISDIGSQIDALAREGLFHRDIKPTNIFLSNKRGVVLGDWGSLSWATDPEIWFSPAYSSAETRGVIHASVGLPAEVFSLAITTCELMIGARPFDPRRDNPHRIQGFAKPTYMQASWMREFLSRHKIKKQGELSHVLSRGLSYYPADRYQSAGDFVGELKNALI
jgi:serine/threonine protein kinase